MTQPASEPGYLRAVGRWQILGLSINDVIGSGVYLLPAATFALLGPFSLWAVLLAGLAVALLVMCYAQAASYFDQPGGSYLYAREAFGPYVGFQVGWTIWLTRVSVAASLSNGLADALTRFWPAAADGPVRIAIVAGSLLLLIGINIAGVRWAAHAASVLVIGKVVPLLLFIGIGLFAMDWGQAFSGPPVDTHNYKMMGEAALLLLFAYAGFENLPAAAGEYHRPQRNVPFALLSMITIVTLLYAGAQLVAQGTLPDLGASKAPLADASDLFAGPWLAVLLTFGAAVSILGTNSNTMLLGPRFLQSLAQDGYGPSWFARLHPRFHTPAAAIATQGLIALVLALSGSFVQLALLSTVTRLLGYICTAAGVLVLHKRYGDRPDALRLPGGPLIPVLALLLTLGLMAAASWQNLLAMGVALLIGTGIYLARRTPRSV
ncbi:amino acid transporter [Pseudoxanthomonas kalamensis DSM 18571]|uniref:APC family permease n=1 Tax=Pseudoxanthomonas kalamensis TaxID=289483 RepID=UPI001390C784|nr:APC family permease [Pseudoxanthomonas kalamensis]KAF1712598.1 amino acid transporter [Pseudoxanthomonas kalamensis DSM 18571]